nr:Krueppel-like factor 16 isoform X1 [Macaca fascicularis]
MAKLGSSRGRWQVLGPQGSPLEEGADPGAGVTRRVPTTSRAEAPGLGGLGNRWPVVHLTIGQGSACVARPGGGEAGTPSCLQVALVRGSFKRGRCFSLSERRAPRHLRGRGTDGSGSGGARAEVAMAAVAGVRLWTKRRSRWTHLLELGSSLLPGRRLGAESLVHPLSPVPGTPQGGPLGAGTDNSQVTLWPRPSLVTRSPGRGGEADPAQGQCLEHGCCGCGRGLPEMWARPFQWVRSGVVPRVVHPQAAAQWTSGLSAPTGVHGVPAWVCGRLTQALMMLWLLFVRRPINAKLVGPTWLAVFCMTRWPTGVLEEDGDHPCLAVIPSS